MGARLSVPVTVLACVSFACILVSGCSGSSNGDGRSSGAPRPAPLRSMDACGAASRVPGTRTAVVPSADLPPTVVLRAGAALTFPAGRSSAQVGFAGPTNPGEQAVVCRARGDGQVVLVTRRPGYVRIGVQGGHQQRLVLLKVTS